jgi:hypothetical protein
VAVNTLVVSDECMPRPEKLLRILLWQTPETLEDTVIDLGSLVDAVLNEIASCKLVG